MDIGAAEATIDLFYNKGLIRNYADLYELEKEDIVNLERFAEKSADNLLKSIEKSKNVPFERVLYSLGIRYVGETVAKILARKFKSIDNLASARLEELTAVSEIGERIARSVNEYFDSDANKKTIERLKNYGLNMEIKEQEEAVEKVFDGKTFVISGTFENYSREQMKDLIEKYGGKTTSSVSSKTDYLLAGANAGPSKLEKAKKQNVEIISEPDFLEKIE